MLVKRINPKSNSHPGESDEERGKRRINRRCPACATAHADKNTDTPAQACTADKERKLKEEE
jgi:hypothetical protein